ncbi:MAG: hypothetical protein ACLFP4_04900 [Spirochaetales bacterium]
MRLRAVKLVVAVALFLVVAAALFTDLFGRQLIPGLPKLQLQRVERTQTSVVTISDVRAIAELATIQVIHRAVFPYDYLPQEVSLAPILRKLRNSDRSVRDTLSEEEYRYFRTYSLSQEVDLGVTGGTFDFVVVTLVMTAGIDFAEHEISLEVSKGEEALRRVIVDLPEASVLDVALEDIDPETYPYPTASLSAEGWRRVADYVIEQSISPAQEAEIVAEAGRRAHAFIARVLEQAGFDQVEFR